MFKLKDVSLQSLTALVLAFVIIAKEWPSG